MREERQLRENEGVKFAKASAKDREFALRAVRYEGVNLRRFSDMDTRAVDKANSRLRSARKALVDLTSSETFDQFADNWYVFLVCSKGIYTILEQGSKVSPQSRQWFGAKKQIRRNDPLLQYLFEARNDDEHGLSSSVDLVPEKHELGIAEPGYSNSVGIDGGPFRNCTAIGFGTALVIEGGLPQDGIKLTSLDGKPILSRHTPATTILIDVNARGDRKYHAPVEHLGAPLADTTPIGVARAAISYFESLLGEASKLVTRK